MRGGILKRCSGGVGGLEGCSEFAGDRIRDNGTNGWQREDVGRSVENMRYLTRESKQSEDVWGVVGSMRVESLDTFDISATSTMPSFGHLYTQMPSVGRMDRLGGVRYLL